jgi:FAD/FMN-containing dehydrogenase
MKVSLWRRLVAGVRGLVARLWGGEQRSLLLPASVPELLTVLGQARDNCTVVGVVGGAFPASGASGQVTVSLARMDRLLGLDSGQRTVTVEPGMRLSVLSALLATVHLTLELSGRVPDLTVLDALAVGTSGSAPPGSLGASVQRVEAVTAAGEVVAWSWSSHPRQMAALVCGLGTAAILTSVTFTCSGLTRVNEISYLSSVRELMDTWSLVSRSSTSQELIWFPFTELVVISHTSELDRLSWAAPQPLLGQALTGLSSAIAALTRRLNLALFSSLPLLSSMLARVQFISLWTAARHRSDHTHHPVHFTRWPQGRCL